MLRDEFTVSVDSGTFLRQPCWVEAASGFPPGVDLVESTG